MRDDEQEGQSEESQEEYKGPRIEDPVSLRRLRAIRRKVPVIWENIKKILKQPATNLGPTLIGLFLYGYASLIGYLFEKELVHLFDENFNLSHYLTFTDFPFLAVKNTISFLVFILGPPILCILIAGIIIFVSVILDVLHLVISSIYQYLRYVAGLKWQGVKYANYRDEISADIKDSSRVEYYVVLLYAVILSIIKNIFILVFREFIAWSLHKVKSRLAWIGAFIFGIWEFAIRILLNILYPLRKITQLILDSILDPLRRVILVALFLIVLASPALIVLSPTLLGYIPDLGFLPAGTGKKLQMSWKEFLKEEWYPFNDGQVHTARPSECFEKVKQISSTEKYAIFSLPETSENGAGKLLAIPMSNLASFQVGNKEPCKSETEITDMERDIVNIKIALMDSDEAGVIRGSEIDALQVGMQKNTEAGAIRGGEIKELQKKVEEIVLVDSGLTKAVETLQAGVKENTEAGIRRDGKIKANKESVDMTHEAVKSNRLVLQRSIEAGGRRDVEIKTFQEKVKVIVPVDGGLTKAVKTLQAGVKENTEAGIRRDGEIRTFQVAVDMNTKADGNRDGEIKTLQEGVKKNTEAVGKRDDEIMTIKQLAKATREKLQNNIVAGIGRDGEIEAIKKSVKKNTEVGVRRNVGIKTNKESVDTTREAVKSNRLALQKSIEAGGRRDVEIKALQALVQTNRKAAVENTQAAVALEGELKTIKKTVNATQAEVKKGAGVLEEVKTAVGESKKVIDRLLSRLPGIPVSRYATYVKTGSKTNSEIRYLLSGFPHRQFVLNQNQSNWLNNFHNTIMSCESKSRPSIRLVGFASSEHLPISLGNQYKHLCYYNKDAPPLSSDIDSDLNNCRLANLRVASVAAFFESKQLNGKDITTIMKQMDRHCEKGEKIVLNPGLSHIKIKPWCKLGDMKKERFSMAKLSPDVIEGQPHFLNRSVHIVFEKPGKCIAFSKKAQ